MSRAYCHFSFRRPKKYEGYGYFAVAFYSDYDGKKLIGHTTVKKKLWFDNQWVTAIQSYENALRVISELQHSMITGGYTSIILVTDNSILAGWIDHISPKNQFYDDMMKAVANYRCGGPREIKLSVGLAEPRNSEKSYKYCSEKYLEEVKEDEAIEDDNGVNKLSAKGSKITDLMDDDDAVVEGMSVLM